MGAIGEKRWEGLAVAACGAVLLVCECFGCANPKPAMSYKELGSELAAYASQMQKKDGSTDLRYRVATEFSQNIKSGSKLLLDKLATGTDREKLAAYIIVTSFDNETGAAFIRAATGSSVEEMQGSLLSIEFLYDNAYLRDVKKGRHDVIEATDAFLVAASSAGDEWLKKRAHYVAERNGIDFAEIAATHPDLDVAAKRAES